MTTATNDEVAELLGDTEDMYINRIVDTGASITEVAEALDEVQDERRFGEEQRIASSPRVAAVKAILEEMLDEGDDEESALPIFGEAP